MRHKYETSGIVLARTPLGEANTLVTLLTPTVGVVRARAQALRKPGAKLAAALVTFAESDLVLVRGKDGWRIAGAVLKENWFSQMPSEDARARAARVSGLLVRLAPEEDQNTTLYSLVRSYFEASSTVPCELLDEAEIVAALGILAALGLDAGALPTTDNVFTAESLRALEPLRAEHIERINHGIAASGL